MINNNSNFECLNCHKKVKLEALGTANRNHCPYCLYSKHVDEDTPGDRKANCFAKMKPIGLTFKLEGLDKWSKEKQGELMLVHLCECGRISINRIAGDDDPVKILKILTNLQNIDGMTKTILAKSQIKLLNNSNLPQIKQQLYGIVC